MNLNTKATLGLSRHTLLVVLMQWMAIFAAGAASYKEIETAVRSEDFVHIQSMISTDGGVKTDTGALCLMVAALWNKQALAERVLAAGVSPNASPIYGHEAGETPLTYAIFGAHENIVAFLLARGANPNYRGDCDVVNCRGRMPLDLAVKYGLLGTARRLLDAGADLNAGQNFAVETANQVGDVKMFQLLLAHGGQLPAASSKESGVEAERKGKANFNADPLHSLGLAELLPQTPGAPPKPGSKTRCRLAIIAEDASVTAADVLATRLTAQPGLELIERQELDRVFAEKQLTRQFAAQQANYNSVAPLLRADALLLIRTRDLGNSKAVEAQFIRVHPGIVLDTVYRAAPLTDVKSWAEEMSARVLGLARKAVRDGAISLSVLDVHAALPTPVTAGLERTLTVLLRDRLIHDPRFIVLERAEMEKVAFENAGEKPFWTGSYLVDPLVDAALDNSGQFTLTVQLQPAGKGVAIGARATGKRSGPGRAIDDLLQQIDSQMGGPASPQTHRDVTAEAHSYLQETRWALAAKMPERAADAAEVTWALGLQNLEVARLRVRSAEESVHNAMRRRQTPDAVSAAEPLEFAIRAVGIWDDVLQGELLREHPTELRPWLESISDLADVVTLAIISVGPATEQLEQADRLGILRKMYWGTLNHALLRSRELAPNSGLPERISRTQLGTARIILPDGDELRAALQEILSRHFATNDTIAAAELRLGISWLPTMTRRIDAYSSSAEMKYRYPDNDPVEEWLLESLRKSSAPEDRFLASAIEFDGWVILTAERSALLMEEFWDMRDELAQDGELFKLYFARLHRLTENEPIGDTGYVPRTYQLNLKQDESANKQSHDMTWFEFYGRLYLYLINHAKRPQPAFDELVSRYMSRHSPEQNNELQQAYDRYAARTGAGPVGFFSAPPAVVRRSKPTPASATNTLPLLHVSRFWHPFDLGRSISPDFLFQAGSMVWAEDRLWFEGSVRDFESNPQVMHHYIFAVDPLTMQTDVIELPLIPVIPQAPGPMMEHGVRFAVRPECLVVTAALDFFALYDRAAQRWQTYPEIQPARVEKPEIIGDFVYLVVEQGSAVISFDLKRCTTKVLASTRRRPAATPLDDPALWFSQIWKNETGELIVIAQSDHAEYLKKKSVAQAWSPSSQTWKLVEGPVRELNIRRPSVPIDRPPSTPFVEVAGNVTADDRAGGSGLALQLRNQAKPFDKIPLLALPTTPLRLPDNRYGPQKLTIRLCCECPAGYVFPPRSGAGFWFLPKKDFENYVQSASRPVETARP